MASTLTINLTSMVGDAGQLDPIPLDATVRELAHAVRDKMAVPIAAQNLIWNGELITDPSLKLEDLFGFVETADIMVVRRALTEEEHSELYANLVRATTGGNTAEVVELLKEGARLEPIRPDIGTEPEEEHKTAEDSEANETAQFFEDRPTPGPAEKNQQCGGLSPMMMAVAMQNHAIAEMLRDRGAPEPDMKSQSESLAKAFAAGDFADVVRHVAGGADLQTKLRRGEGIRATSSGVPLHACCAMHREPGSYEVAQLLIKMKADTSQGDSEGDTPLAHAQYFGAKDIFELLESNGAVVAGPYYSMFGRR